MVCRDRSEEAAEKLQVEVHVGVDVFEQSIKASLLGRSATASSQFHKLGKRKFSGDDDDDNVLIASDDDDDDFYDRTKRKSKTAHATTNSARGQRDAPGENKGVLETAETLWEKKYMIEKELTKLDEDLAAARRAEATKQASTTMERETKEGASAEDEEEDELDKFMMANNAVLERQQPLSASRDASTLSAADIETEIQEKKRALEYGLPRVQKLIDIADPMGEFQPVRHQMQT